VTTVLHARDITDLARKAWDATKDDADPVFDACALTHKNKLEVAARAVVETGRADIQGLERFEAFIAGILPTDGTELTFAPEPVPSPEFLAAAAKRRDEFAAHEAKLLEAEHERLAKEADKKAADEAAKDAKEAAELQKLIAANKPKEVKHTDTAAETDIAAKKAAAEKAAAAAAKAKADAARAHK
jgi:hypothetical protein